MCKIYIFKQNDCNYKYQKFTIYENIEDLILKIGGKQGTICEYELKSSISVHDYHKQNDRDLQLRGVLNELSDYEVSINKLIDILDGEETTIKIKSYLRYMRRVKNNKKAIKSFIVKNRLFFLNEIDDIEWYYNLLKIHNFMDKGHNKNFTKAKIKNKRDEIKNSSIC
jgi:hypothetical protein